MPEGFHQENKGTVFKEHLNCWRSLLRNYYCWRNLWRTYLQRNYWRNLRRNRWTNLRRNRWTYLWRNCWTNLWRNDWRNLLRNYWRNLRRNRWRSLLNCQGSNLEHKLGRCFQKWRTYVISARGKLMYSASSAVVATAQLSVSRGTELEKERSISLQDYQN